MLCKFTENSNLRRFGAIGMRALLSVGLCLGFAVDAFAQATSDIVVNIQGASADVPAGQPVQFQAVVSNFGPDAADGTGYQITFTPPLAGSMANCGPSNGPAVCTPPNTNGNGFVGTVPTLPSGSGISIVIDGQAPGGTFTATIQAFSPAGVTDPNNANNTSTATTLPVTLQQFDVK